MKKLFLFLAVSVMLAAGCTNNSKTTNPKEQTDPATAAREAQYKKDLADWENWENLTDERKNELLNGQKAIYDAQKAAKEAREARRAKFEAAMENWDNLSLDERKAAFELINPRAAKQEGATTPGKPNDNPSSK